MKNYIHKTFDSARDLLSGIVPYTCPGCGSVSGKMVCDECLKNIPLIDHPYCKKCGRQLPPGIVLTEKCRECRERKNKFDVCRSPFLYDSPIDVMVKKYKFYYNIRMGDMLGKLLADKIKSDPEFFNGYEKADAVVPVPLHPFRYLKRGFNQSATLSKFISDALDIDIFNCLARVRHTPPQSKLSAGERRKNVKGAFALKRNVIVDDMSLILVDDVMTTGATVNECANLLHHEGAREVLVLTVARRL